MSPINTILFDLDGTLLDTAPDMVAALNILLENNQQAPLPFTAVRNSVSKGSLALVKLGFNKTLNNLTAEQIHKLQQDYLNIYSQHLCIDSGLFAGMADVLARLEASEVPWGIVTNKPGWLAEPLLKQLQLSHRAACIVSGDTTLRRKPFPDPLLHACELIQRQPQQCVYIGDNQRDIDAGNAAGMQTLVAQYGYIDATEKPEQWGADGMLEHVEQLHTWLDMHTDITSTC